VHREMIAYLKLLKVGCILRGSRVVISPSVHQLLIKELHQAHPGFQEFITQNGIVHKRSSLYHPATNGLVERAVQTFKNGMRKLRGPLETRLSRFLFNYHITLQSSTGVSPAELIFG